MINNLVDISDLHSGCQFGLCPDKEIALDGGGRYIPSALQKKVWVWWNIFWHEWVPVATRGEPFAVCLSGDATDGRHHGSTTQVSQNLSDQAHIAFEILEPIVNDLCARDENDKPLFFMVRGTEAHVGASAENEEMLATRLNAVQDEIGNHARNDLWIRLGNENGCLCHIAHHIGVTGSTHYESSAPMKEVAEAFYEAGRWAQVPPDVVIRSHRHRHIKVELDTARGYGISEVTPGWQLKTPFVYKLPGGRTSNPQFGGILIRQGDEEFYTRSKVWGITRPAEVQL